MGGLIDELLLVNERLAKATATPALFRRRAEAFIPTLHEFDSAFLHHFDDETNDEIHAAVIGADL